MAPEMHPKCARKVSGVSRNARQGRNEVYVFVSDPILWPKIRIPDPKKRRKVLIPDLTKILLILMP